MSRKCSRSKENGFLAIPYSWNKLLHNTSKRGAFGRQAVAPLFFAVIGI
jgi:hypothetical protein